MHKRRELLEAWKAIANELLEGGYTQDELCSELRGEVDAIPLTAFGHTLTPLEAAARYLEHSGKDLDAISLALARPKGAIERTLAHSHSKAHALTYASTDKTVPAAVLAVETPASEALCSYLKTRYALTNKQIADALGLDQRTVWTILDRAKKRGGRT